MSTHIPSLSELNQHVSDALIREVGVIDTIRFLNQFRTVHSDYRQSARDCFSAWRQKILSTELRLVVKEKQPPKVEQRRRCRQAFSFSSRGISRTRVDSK